MIFVVQVTLAELNKQLESGNLDAKELVVAKAGQARDYPQVWELRCETVRT